MLLIITSAADELSSGTNIDDLERPWTLKIGVFSEFSAILGCNTHFKNELPRNQGWSKTLLFGVLLQWSMVKTCQTMTQPVMDRNRCRMTATRWTSYSVNSPHTVSVCLSDGLHLSVVDPEITHGLTTLHIYAKGAYICNVVRLPFHTDQSWVVPGLTYAYT